MQRSMRTLCLFAFSAALAYAAFPRVTSVEPAMAQPGEEATASGSALNEVVKLFLTLGNKDIEVEVKDSSEETILFALPADLEHGVYQLTIQTGGASPAIMVQPVRIEVADAEAIAQRKKEAEELEALEAAPPPEEPEPAPTDPQ